MSARHVPALDDFGDTPCAHPHRFAWRCALIAGWVAALICAAVFITTAVNGNPIAAHLATPTAVAFVIAVMVTLWYSLRAGLDEQRQQLVRRRSDFDEGFEVGHALGHSTAVTKLAPYAVNNHPTPPHSGDNVRRLHRGS